MPLIHDGIVWTWVGPPVLLGGDPSLDLKPLPLVMPLSRWMARRARMAAWRAS